MTSNAIRLALFTIFCALSAFIAWLGGYDFNTRGPHVATWALLTLIFSILFASVPLE